jgi:hypothetical protein
MLFLVSTLEALEGGLKNPYRPILTDIYIYIYIPHLSNNEILSNLFYQYNQFMAFIFQLAQIHKPPAWLQVLI